MIKDMIVICSNIIIFKIRQHNFFTHQILFVGETQYDDPQVQFPRPIPDEVIR